MNPDRELNKEIIKGLSIFLLGYSVWFFLHLFSINPMIVGMFFPDPDPGLFLRGIFGIIIIPPLVLMISALDLYKFKKWAWRSIVTALLFLMVRDIILFIFIMMHQNECLFNVGSSRLLNMLIHIIGYGVVLSLLAKERKLFKNSKEDVIYKSNESK